MGHFVSQDCRQSIIVGTNWQDSGENENLAARQNKRILGLWVINDIDLTSASPKRL
jgi:hypothetical protein